MDLDRFGHPGPDTEVPPAAAAGVANGSGRPAGRGAAGGRSPPATTTGSTARARACSRYPPPTGGRPRRPTTRPAPTATAPARPRRGPVGQRARAGTRRARAPGAPGVGRPNGQRPVAALGAPTPPAPPGRPSGPRHAAGGERPVPAGSPAFRAGSGPGGPPAPAARRRSPALAPAGATPQPPPGYTTAPRLRPAAAHRGRGPGLLRLAAGALRHRRRHRRARDGGPARHQRRRQVDPAQGRLGPAAAQQGQGRLRRQGHHVAARREDRPAAACRSCRAARASSRR